MRFSLEIELGNDAMQSYLDIETALQDVARRMHEKARERGNVPIELGAGEVQTGVVRDLNGNQVGTFTIKEPDA